MTKEVEPASAELVNYGSVEAALLDPSVQIADDPDRSAREIIEQILRAESADDVLARAEAIHARDMLDEPFVALGVRFLNSDFAGEGMSIYAVIDGSTKAGERIVVTCGARNVVAQLHRLGTLGSFPIPVMIVESGRARPGQSAPMRLVKPDSF